MSARDRALTLSRDYARRLKRSADRTIAAIDDLAELLGPDDPCAINELLGPEARAERHFY